MNIFSSHQMSKLPSVAQQSSFTFFPRQQKEEINHYEKALDAAGSGAFEWNITRNVKWWSPVMYSLYDISPTQGVPSYEQWLHRIHPEDRDCIHTAIQTCIHTDASLDVEFRVYERRKQPRWIKMKGNTYVTSRNELMLIGMSYDITSRKQTEQLLKFKSEAVRILSSSLDYKTSLKEMAKVAIATVADWCIVVLQPTRGEQEITCIEHAFPENITWAFSVLKQATRQKTPHGLSQVLHHGKPEFHVYMTDEYQTNPEQYDILLQKIKPVSYITVPFLLNGKTIGVMSLLSKESGRQYTSFHLEVFEQLASRIGLFIGHANLYEDIKQERELLSTLVSRKDEFITVASHELKTPLTSIKAYAQLLEKIWKDEGDVRTSAYLTRMNKQINKLTTLIYELLNTTRIHAGKLMLNKQEFRVQDIIEETIYDLSSTYNSHTIAYHCDPHIMLYADREHIEQVLLNLLTNAIKYSPPGSTITITASRTNGIFQLSVADQGVGIPKKEQKRIFERFYQVEESKRSYDPSLGVGLYITQEIIKGHNGTITVESDVGKGSIFTISLPDS